MLMKHRTVPTSSSIWNIWFFQVVPIKYFPPEPKRNWKGFVTGPSKGHPLWWGSWTLSGWLNPGEALDWLRHEWESTWPQGAHSLVGVEKLRGKGYDADIFEFNGNTKSSSVIQPGCIWQGLTEKLMSYLGLEKWLRIHQLVWRNRPSGPGEQHEQGLWFVNFGG